MLVKRICYQIVSIFSTSWLPNSNYRCTLRCVYVERKCKLSASTEKMNWFQEAPLKFLLKIYYQEKINQHFILTPVYFGIRSKFLQASNETKHPHCSKNTAKIFWVTVRSLKWKTQVNISLDQVSSSLSNLSRFLLEQRGNRNWREKFSWLSPNFGRRETLHLRPQA